MNIKCYMSLVKSVYQIKKNLISQPKHILWVLERTFSMTKHMIKLMGKKIFAILRSKVLFI